MARLINNNVYIFIFISMLFYAPKIQAAYVPTHLLLNNHRKSNSHYNVYNIHKTSNELILERICNSKPRPCDNCRGKFYTVKNEPFSKNFIVVRDSVNRFLYVYNIVCNDSKMAWYVKYPCKNHIHTVRFVNPEWTNERITDNTEDIYFTLVILIIVLFCCSPIIYDIIFPKKSWNTYLNDILFLIIVTTPFLIILVFLATDSSNKDIEPPYCIRIVNADSTLTDTITYRIDSTYHK